MAETRIPNAAAVGVGHETELMEEEGELTERETAFVHAVTNFSNASVHLVALCEEHMGKDTKEWTTSNPIMKRIRRKLRNFWVEFFWKDGGLYGRARAIELMDKDATEIVETMQTELSRKPSEFEKGSDKAIFIERMNRNFQNHFQNKVLNPAKLLHEVPTVLMTINRRHLFQVRSHSSFFNYFYFLATEHRDSGPGERMQSRSDYNVGSASIWWILFSCEVASRNRKDIE